MNCVLILNWLFFSFQLAEALLVKETLNYDDVVALIGPPKYDAARRKIDPVEFEESIKTLSDETKASP